MDVHVPRAITAGLRRRRVDVLTAQEDGSDRLDDPPLLERANQLQRILFTSDRDLLVEAALRQRKGIPFPGLIYAHPLRVSIGACIRDLQRIASSGEPDDLRNRVQFLPLR
jgi:hypothetical protein